jgi:O-acetyl-ADP-ribose deacetylase (regulator of RNase III)/NAD-dependent SIR2 family protein deacetylase
MQVNSSLARAALLSALRDDNRMIRDDITMPSMLLTEADHSEHLGDILISSNTHWKEETLSLIDQLLDNEASKLDRVAINTIPPRATAGGADVVV